MPVLQKFVYVKEYFILLPLKQVNLIYLKEKKNYSKFFS